MPRPPHVATIAPRRSSVELGERIDDTIP